MKTSSFLSLFNVVQVSQFIHISLALSAILIQQRDSVDLLLDTLLLQMPKTLSLGRSQSSDSAPWHSPQVIYILGI